MRSSRCRYVPLRALHRSRARPNLMRPASVSITMNWIPLSAIAEAVESISSTGRLPGVYGTLHLPSDRTTITGLDPFLALSFRMSYPLIRPWISGVRPPVGISARVL